LARFQFCGLGAGVMQPQEVGSERRRETSRLAVTVVLVVALLAGLAIRLPRVSQPPLDYQPIRQLSSAMIARRWYFNGSRSIPEWRREVANANARGLLEPPVMEALSVLLYHVSGREWLGFPRGVAAICWLAGGIFLFRLGEALFSPVPALAGVVFYLFVPQGILSSTAFMPDSLMLCLAIAALYAIVSHDEWPSRGRLGVAAALAGLSSLIKPFPLFIFLPVFAFLAVRRRGWRDGFTDPQSVAFAALTTAPFLAWALRPGFPLRWKLESSVMPQLLLTQAYWVEWLTLAASVVGWLGLVLVVAASFAVRGRPRALLLGLSLGYVAFGLFFSYHAHTHDYYHLLLVPVVALSIAALAHVAIETQRFDRLRGGPAGACALLAGVALLGAVMLKRPTDESEPARRIEVAEHIGELVGRGARLVSLSGDYGLVLGYYGELTGPYWPGSPDLWHDSLRGKQPVPVAERFDDLVRRFSPDYFVVTWMEDYRRQVDLAQLLSSRYPLLAETADYLVFDLRAREVK
jgi:4-amino-4-deoxy-L-arabinose transferase-like glycosyltransferase